MALIPADHNGSLRNGNRPDEQVGVIESLPLSFEHRFDLAKDLNRNVVELEHRKGRKKPSHQVAVALRCLGLCGP